MDCADSSPRIGRSKQDQGRRPESGARSGSGCRPHHVQFCRGRTGKLLVVLSDCHFRRHQHSYKIAGGHSASSPGSCAKSKPRNSGSRRISTFAANQSKPCSGTRFGNGRKCRFRMICLNRRGISPTANQSGPSRQVSGERYQRHTTPSFIS